MITDIRAEKNQLRSLYKNKRLSMLSQKKYEADQTILQRILASSYYKKARQLFLYVSTPIEVDTHKLIQTALKSQKTVAVPRCIDGTRDMAFYQIYSMNDLSPGTFSVLEPLTDKCRKISISNPEVSLCIVPGLAFDLFGYRLGYGKGYYDRWLNQFSAQIPKLGICYCNCTANRLPHGRYDVPVDVLITEKYTRLIRRENL